MIINHNIAAMNTHRQLGSNNAQASKNLEKLSSGLKINKAGDDAAGLAISEKMRGQIRGLDMAQKNAQDGISLIQTAEGALNETHDILQRMRELAVQSSNDTNTSTDRKELQKELDQLSVEITRISTDTEFNTQKLLDGKFTDKTFHIGSNGNQNLKISVDAMGAEALKVNGFEITPGAATIDTGLAMSNTSEKALSYVSAKSTDTAEVTETVATYDKDTGAISVTLAKAATASGGAITSTRQDVADAINKLNIDGLTITVTAGAATEITSKPIPAGTVSTTPDLTKGIDISTQPKADSAITTINNAIETVSAERSKLGAVQNRLEHTINNLGTSSENLTQAESRIRDVDYVLSAA